MPTKIMCLGLIWQGIFRIKFSCKKHRKSKIKVIISVINCNKMKQVILFFRIVCPALKNVFFSKQKLKITLKARTHYPTSFDDTFFPCHMLRVCIKNKPCHCHPTIQWCVTSSQWFFCHPHGCWQVCPVNDKGRGEVGGICAVHIFAYFFLQEIPSQ